MEPLQILLVALGVFIAAGGVVMLVRLSRGGGGVESARRPYVPLAVVAVGLGIAYRSFSDYERLDGEDIAIMLVFVLALLSLLGLQFFIVDKFKAGGDDAGSAPAPRRELEE